jgi:glycosyltransferase involved in cell wall biosynthesis
MRDIPSIVVRNGVNPEHFRPGQKFIDGKIHVVSCHWSDNSLKGEWAHRFLDDFVGQHSDRFCYTFIGRSQHKFRHAEHIEPIGNPAELGACLAQHHVCINATHADPGPNSVAEPIACGVPTYVSSTGGGAVEFAGADHTFTGEADLAALLLSGQFTLNTTRSLFKSWDEVHQQVVNFRDSINKS